MSSSGFESGWMRRVCLALLLSAVPCGGVGAAAAGCREHGASLERQLDAEQWRQVERLEIVDWLIEIEDSPVKEGIAVGLVEAPAARVYRVVTDNARFAEFMPYVEESTIESPEDGSTVNYQHLDLPWPISDREYKVRLVNLEPDEESAAWRSTWTHVKGFGNIEESRGAWRVFPCGESALVEYRVLTDPGGRIPTYFKNKATRRSLQRLIEAVRDRVDHPSYDAPE